jgi:hypothetical protein
MNLIETVNRARNLLDNPATPDEVFSSPEINQALDEYHRMNGSGIIYHQPSEYAIDVSMHQRLVSQLPEYMQKLVSKW